MFKKNATVDANGGRVKAKNNVGYTKSFPKRYNTVARRQEKICMGTMKIAIDRNKKEKYLTLIFFRKFMA